MVRPVYTLLRDSFRMLKARVIFWVTMGISAFVAILYLSIGFSDTGMTLFFGATEIESAMLNRNSPMAETFYLGIFSKFIAGVWLSWIAIMLALISCASIFPDTMNEGSAAVVMTKSLGRLWIFVTKYVGSLFFVAIQVGVFCLIVFFALKWRVGSWNPSVFWFVPLVVLVFSYLYSVLVLTAVKTRSVLVAILVSVGFWFVCWILAFGEGITYDIKQNADRDALAESPINLESIDRWHGLSKVVYGLVPKTGPTLELADRVLVVNGERGFSDADFLGTMMGADDVRLQRDLDRDTRRHSVFYVLGTSLLFEFVVLSLAAWTFCRRDY